MRPSRLSGMLIIIFLIWLVALLLLGCAERRLTVTTQVTRVEIHGAIVGILAATK